MSQMTKFRGKKSDYLQLKAMAHKLWNELVSKHTPVAVNKDQSTSDEPSSEDETIDNDSGVNILTLVGKLDYFRRIGCFGQSALGDDYAAVTIRPKGVPDEAFADLYMSIEGWDVAWHKSLTTPFSIEFLREQAIPGYVVKMRLTNDEAYGKVVSYILTVKPTAHVLKTFVFPETIDSHGKAISTLSQIMRWRNLENHPNLHGLILKLKDMFYFKLLTEDSWYVPLFNLDAWVKAGKPKDGSSFHVRITNITSLITIATKEAEYIQTQLLNVLDVAWTQTTKSGYDPIGELPKCRLIRMLEAMRTNNHTELEEIINEVRKVKDQSFIINYNMGIEESESEEVEEEIIVELSRQKYVPNLTESD